MHVDSVVYVNNTIAHTSSHTSLSHSPPLSLSIYLPFFLSLSLALFPSSLAPPLSDDIEVLFYEEKNDNSINPVQPWSAKGRFGPNDVHHQYAIVFQTPPFYNLAIERPVTVWIALRRPSDSELSEPKPFLYLPQEFGKTLIQSTHTHPISKANYMYM